jgi:hypothetical protein
MSIKPQVAIFLLAAALAAPAFSQDDWNSLRSLKPGQRIGVVQADGKVLRGTFASFSDPALSIRTDQVIVVPKDSVIRVYRRPRIGRGVRVVIGTGIGVAGGAALNATIGQYLRNEAHGTSPAVWIGAGAAIGAGLGALSGGGEQVVYRRHP